MFKKKNISFELASLILTVKWELFVFPILYMEMLTYKEIRKSHPHS